MLATEAIVVIHCFAIEGSSSKRIEYPNAYSHTVSVAYARNSVCISTGPSCDCCRRDSQSKSARAAMNGSRVDIDFFEKKGLIDARRAR